MRIAILLIILLVLTSFAEEPHQFSKTQPSDTTVDSAMIDSLKTELANQKAYLYDHPTAIDTLFSTRSFSRYRLHRKDYVTWSDLLYHPLFTSVYYSPNSHLNRILPWGYTFLQKENDLLNGIQSRNIPTLPFEPLHIKGLKISDNGTLTPEFQTRKLISPEIFICSETGLFKGNSLELRLIRNMTRYLSIGVFTSYRELKRTNFNHNNGSMYQMFKGWGIDPEDLSNTGYNPEAVSQLSKVSLLWNKNRTIGFDFTYGDLRNDHLYESDETINKDSLWFSEADYLSKLKATFEDTLTEKVSLYVEGQYSKNRERRKPLNEIVYNGSQTDGGATDYLGFGTRLDFNTLGAHHFALKIGVNRNETEQYNRVSTTVYQGDLYITDTITPEGSRFTLFGGAGPTLIHTARLPKDYRLRCDLNGELQINKNFKVTTFFKRDITPTSINYDTALVVYKQNAYPENTPTAVYPNYFGDSYIQTGLTSEYKTKNVYLYGAYGFLAGIDSIATRALWSRSLAPYENANHTFIVAPSLFINKAISLSSHLAITDTKPHIKSSSNIQFHINRYGATRHFYIDLYNTFWSEREPITYSGISTWNKPVHDIGLKLTAEIKSFRIFYKIDNFLNRNHSYIPGYAMPGFTIRWGFNWTITG